MIQDAHVLTPIGSADKHLDLQLCPIELTDKFAILVNLKVK